MVEEEEEEQTISTNLMTYLPLTGSVEGPGSVILKGSDAMTEPQRTETRLRMDREHETSTNLITPNPASREERGSQTMVVY